MCEYNAICAKSSYIETAKESRGLTNYWSFSSNLNDNVGTANLYGGQNAALTDDRFGNPNSALALNDGFLLAPPGVYFDGEFSATAWVRVRKYTNSIRILDFGIGHPYASNVLFAATWNEGLMTPGVQGYNADSIFFAFTRSHTPYPLDTWTHLAVTVGNGQASVYINGQLTGSGSTNGNAPNILRTVNYIGRSGYSNYHDCPYATADFDEMRIFNKRLCEEEILDDYNNNFR